MSKAQKQLPEAAIIAAYIPGVTSFRELARRFGTTHRTIKRILVRNNQPILTAKEFKYFQLSVRLRWDISYIELVDYDYDKLVVLNSLVKNRDDRYNFTKDQYLAYLEKFYTCPQFNRLHELWINSGKNKLRQLSIDHIHPISKGGDDICIENMQVVTWIENRAKCALSQDDWDYIKDNIGEFFV